MIRRLDCSKCGVNQADKGLIALPVTYICHDCYLIEKAKEDTIKKLNDKNKRLVDALGTATDYVKGE